MAVPKPQTSCLSEKEVWLLRTFIGLLTFFSENIESDNTNTNTPFSDNGSPNAGTFFYNETNKGHSSTQKNKQTNKQQLHMQTRQIEDHR